MQAIKGVMDTLALEDIKKQADDCFDVIEKAVQHLLVADSAQKVDYNLFGQENVVLKKRVEDLTAENRQLVNLVKKYQSSLSENLIYAEKYREARVLLEDHKAHMGQLRQELDLFQKMVADVTSKEQQNLQAFYEQREHDTVQFRLALEARDREKEEMKVQIEAMKKKVEDERFKWSQELQARDDNLGKKQKEIDDLKKEIIKNNQQHEQQLQRLRTKYDEQMLQLTQIGRK